MKKILLVLLISFSTMFAPLLQAVEPASQRFEDKPALTRNEKKKLSLNMLYLAVPLILAGAVGKTSLGQKIVPLDLPEDPSRKEEKIAAMKWILKLWLISIPVSMPVVHALLKLIKPKIFAHWHRTSYQIAKVCLYYDINIGQYRKILTAAEQRKPDGLLAAINELYPRRFGADWKTRMKTLFDTYKAQAPLIVAKGSFAVGISEDERDFVRMVELGAAMADLYYGTKPNRKTAVDSAIKLYRREIGVLQ